MTQKEKAAQALATCEKELRGLVAEAAQVGDYDAVALLTDCAREVGQIASRVGPEIQSADSDQMIPDGSTPSLPAHPASAKPHRQTYPRFARRENDLIKIGWSKDQKREYEHKAPARILQPLIDSLTRAGSRGKRFSTDQLLPLSEVDGASVPDYQVYALFGWLKHSGLVKQHGRGSYSLQSAAQLSEAVQQAWNTLPQDRSSKD